MEFYDLWTIKESQTKTSADETEEVEFIPRETPCPKCNSDKYGLYHKIRTVDYIPVPSKEMAYPYEVLVERAQAACPNGCLEHKVSMIYNHETSTWLPEKHEEIAKMLLNDAKTNKFFHDSGDHRKCVTSRHCYWLQSKNYRTPKILWKNFVDLALDRENNESV